MKVRVTLELDVESVSAGTQQVVFAMSEQCPDTEILEVNAYATSEVIEMTSTVVNNNCNCACPPSEATRFRAQPATLS